MNTHHTEFIELVFRSYSLLVERGEFANTGFLGVWQQYLELMQQHATSDNLEEIHRTYWLSLCPEISNLANTTQGVN